MLDVLSSRSVSANQLLAIGLICGKRPAEVRNLIDRRSISLFAVLSC